jgi:hypothetical protein
MLKATPARRWQIHSPPAGTALQARERLHAETVYVSVVTHALENGLYALFRQRFLCE